MLVEMTLPVLCEKLEEVISIRRTPLSLVDAICETGASPKVLKSAFEQLVAGGKATFVGGAHRGWNITKARQ